MLIAVPHGGRGSKYWINKKFIKRVQWKRRFVRRYLYQIWIYHCSGVPCIKNETENWRNNRTLIATPIQEISIHNFRFDFNRSNYPYPSNRIVVFKSLVLKMFLYPSVRTYRHNDGYQCIRAYYSPPVRTFWGVGPSPCTQDCIQESGYCPQLLV